LSTVPAPTEVFSSRGVSVWLAELPDRILEADLELLSVEERERTARLARPVDAARFAGSRAVARRLVGTYLSVAPGSIVIGRDLCPACGNGDHGPPLITFPAQDLAFSLSRSGGFALVAVAQRGPVGADLEVVAEHLPLDDVVLRVMSVRERAYLATLAVATRRTAFFRCWVRKEAVVKACGVGIVTHLADVDVAPERAGPVTVRWQPPGGSWQPPGGPKTKVARSGPWQVYDLALPEGLVGAVASPAPAGLADL
jgi:4'-phosphopantetheinyl transferase